MANETKKRSVNDVKAGGKKPAGSKQAGSGKKPAGGSESTNQAASGSKSATAPKAAAARRTRKGIGSTRVKDRSQLSERMNAKTRRRLFLQSTVLDFVLVLVVSAMLTFTVSFAFHSAWDYRGNLTLIVALTIPTLICLYAGTWSKKMVLPSGVATLVMGVLMVGIACAVSPEPFLSGSGIADTEGAYGIFAIVAFLVPVAVFLLSRRPVGLVFLLLLSVLAAGIVQFMYREWSLTEPGVPAAVVMLLGIGMLFVYECYKQSIYSANRVKRTSFAGAFAFSALIGAVCVLVGAGVFYGVVQATSLSTPEVKLFESYVSRPPAEQAQDYDKMDIQGDSTSNNTNDNTDETSDEAEGGTPDVQQGTATMQETFVGRLAMSVAGVNPDTNDPDSNNDAMRLAMELMWILYIALAVAAVVAFLAFWRYRRTLRLKRIAKFSNAYQVYYLYHFLIERFRRVRIAKPDRMTPAEFARDFAKPMYSYTRGTDGVDFIEVTSVYEDAVFGGRQVSDEALARVVRYYRAFYKNAFKATALPKWIFWRFWRL